MTLFLQIREHARSLFHGSKGSHDWEHTERVLLLAETIAHQEGADREIVRLAAVLHDIGRKTEDESGGSVCHAEQGGRMAAGILKDFEVPPDMIHAVVHCISTHRFRSNTPPDSLEAKVLFDADKLDAIGAVGIGRAFLFAGEVGAKLHNPDINPLETLPYTEEDTAYREFSVKLRHVRSRMQTRTGKLMAQARHDFMTLFFEELQKEVSGQV